MKMFSASLTLTEWMLNNSPSKDEQLYFCYPFLHCIHTLNFHKTPRKVYNSSVSHLSLKFNNS
uniref:Uncharacterized protein n=1 Tax=Rhizophora mucronata TaxID=61149 RepID=A0A2P2JP26_RHIMU